MYSMMSAAEQDVEHLDLDQTAALDTAENGSSASRSPARLVPEPAPDLESDQSRGA
jgi:hypothetical protein